MRRRRYAKKASIVEWYLLLGGLVTYSIYFKLYKQISPLVLWGGLTLLLIIGIGLPILKRKRNALLLQNYKRIDSMPGIVFEDFLKEVFIKRGYKVSKTPQTNDYGCDLVLEKMGVKTVVQVKRHSSKVGIAAIQQIIGAIKHYNAAKSMVITNNYYTSSARSLAESNNVELVDRDGVVEMLVEIELMQSEDSLPQLGKKINEKLCPHCEGRLVKRVSKGSQNSFMGCSNFPKCRYTENI